MDQPTHVQQSNGPKKPKVAAAAIWGPTIHDSWAPAATRSTICDVCNTRAGGQAVYQMCSDCSCTICRKCVVSGKMARFPSHALYGVDELDWTKPSSKKKGKQSVQPVQPTKAAGTGKSADGGAESASSTPSVMGSASKSASSDARGAATKSTKGKSYAQEISADAYTGSPVKKILTTPTKASLIKTPVVIDSDSDYEMDAKLSSTSSSKGDEDYEYIPRSKMNRKRSSASLSSAKRGGGQADTAAASTGKPAAVGLANSRPVRAAAIETYEKMRNAKAKKEQEAAEDSTEQAKCESSLAAPANPGQTANADFEQDLQDDGHNKRVSNVYGISTKFEDPEYIQAQVDAAESMRAAQIGEHHHGLPQPHPNPGSNAQGPAAVQSQSAVSAIPVNNDNLADSEKATTTQVEAPNTQAQASATQAAITSATVAQQILDHEEAHRASRALVEAGLDKLSEAMAARARTRAAADRDGKQTLEGHLRDAVTQAWCVNQAIRGFRSYGGDQTAIQVLRGFANIAMVRLKIKDGSFVKQWLDATEKDIQENSVFVPQALQIKAVESVFQEGFNFPTTEEDVKAANALVAFWNR
ncbi:hypothetical protein EsH8_I_000744 [Colletotrichum jinshuiense]